MECFVTGHLNVVNPMRDDLDVVDPKFFKAAGRSSLDKIWRRCFEERVNILLKYVIVP